MSKLTYGEMRTRAQHIYDEEVKERVLAGLEALQEEWGDTWVEKIDCKTLDLSSGAQCVLGQVYGDFDEGVIAICDGEWDMEWATAHGFVNLTPSGQIPEDDYTELDAAWHTVLCDREEGP